MRPKKSILLYCPNEITRRVLTFQMDIWGYRVVSADLETMESVCVSGTFDMVLLVPGFPHKDWRRFHAAATRMEQAQTAAGGSIRIYDTMKVLPISVAPMVHRIPQFPPSVEFLRETIRTLVARKRGPKKILRKELTSPMHLPGAAAEKAAVA
jgi:hypothetical protein